MKKKILITALYKIYCAKSDLMLIAWDFPPQNFKKAYFALKKYLESKGIPVSQPEGLQGEFADWPHFSVAFIPNDTDKDKIEKIKLAGPLYAASLSTTEVKIFKGMDQTYIVWKLKPSRPSALQKFRDFIFDLAGAPKTPSKYPYSPHASLAACEHKYTEALMELEPELQKLLKPYATTYTPEQLQIWENFRIIDIESLKFK